MYGEVTTAVHGAMTQLLEMRCPSFFLGGANGNRPATTTPEERASATAKILRYRKIIWDYALDLAEAATPVYAVDGWEAPRRLLHWLQHDQPQTENLPGGRGANAAEFAAVQDSRLTEAWRRSALAALTGRERELPIVAEKIRFDEARILIRDAADLTWALITLDARYLPLPGWQRLSTKSKWQDAYSTKAPHLVDSALSAAQLASAWGRHVTDAEAAVVDRLGFRAPTPLLPTPHPFGLDGAITAQHNLYVRLGAEFPSADSLAAIVRAQRMTAAFAAQSAASVDADALVICFRRRAENYQRLLGLLVDRVASPLGHGRQAAAEAEAAQRGLEEAVAAGDRPTSEQLDWLRGLFTMTDARVAARINQAIADQRYLVWTDHALSGPAVGGLHRVVRKYEPINGRNHPNLYAAVKEFGSSAGENPERFLAPVAATGRDAFTRAVEAAGEKDKARNYHGNRMSHGPRKCVEAPPMSR